MKSAVDSNDSSITRHHYVYQRMTEKRKSKQLHFICRDEGISLICLGIAEHIDRSKILSVKGLISKSCLAFSLIRTLKNLALCDRQVWVGCLGLPQVASELLKEVEYFAK